MSLTAFYFRKWVNSHKVVQEHARHIGIAFPARDGDGVDIHLWEIPPPETHETILEDGTVVKEQRWRIHVKTKREKPQDPEVSSRRKPSGFQGG